MIKKENPFLWLQNWYLSNCDGDWEHNQNVLITTLDNPGWSIDINLEGTVMEDVEFEKLFTENSEHDWFCCRVEQGKFLGDGGPLNLGDIIDVFRNWVETSCKN